MVRGNALLASIINGYSKGVYKGGAIYFKHFGLLDSYGVESVYRETYKRAKKLGVPTEKQKIETLKDNGDWNERNEQKLKILKSNLGSLKKSKQKLMILTQIKEQNKRIKDCEAEILTLEKNHALKLGNTAEVFAKKRSNEYFIYYSSFLDEKCNIPVCEKGEFDSFPDLELEELVAVYNKIFEPFGGNAIKKTAISDMCINLVSLAQDSAYAFYGKPVVDLTYLQVELLNFSKYYYSILTSGDPPDDVKDDPDKLEDWYNSNQNAKKLIDSGSKSDGDGNQMSTLVGANAEDLKYSGFEDSGKKINLADLARKGKLNTAESFANL